MKYFNDDWQKAFRAIYVVFSRYVPAAIFFLFITWIIVQADLRNDNFIIKIGHAVPLGDKIGHFSLFGVLALLLNMAMGFKRIKIHVRAFHLGSVIVFAFAMVEEFSQLVISSRTFDLVDMVFDLLGIGILSSVAFRKFVVHQLRSFTNYLNRRLLVE